MGVELKLSKSPNGEQARLEEDDMAFGEEFTCFFLQRKKS
jgi:hypothetical protein